MKSIFHTRHEITVINYLGKEYIPYQTSVLQVRYLHKRKCEFKLLIFVSTSTHPKDFLNKYEISHDNNTYTWWQSC